VKNTFVVSSHLVENLFGIDAIFAFVRKEENSRVSLLEDSLNGSIIEGHN